MNAPEVHDRVTEAYFGILGGSFMRHTRARIHWICRRVEGKKVADIGASQGIATILLAREGKQVLAVDSDAKVVGEAKEYLATEPQHVQDRVKIVEADALAYAFKTGAFDTVILAEILEHLTQPESMVKVASACLKKRGRVIATMPFGINDFIDHKSTFYLSSPVHLLHRYFEITEIEVIENWLGITGIRRDKPAEEPPVFDAGVLANVEKKFEEVERRYGDRIGTLMQNLSTAEKLAKTASDQLVETRNKAAAADRQAHLKSAEVQQLQKEVEHAEKRVADLEAALAGLRTDLAKANGSIADVETNLALLNQAIGHALALLVSVESRWASNADQAFHAPDGSTPADTLLLRIQHAFIEMQGMRQELLRARDDLAENSEALEQERRARQAEAEKAGRLEAELSEARAVHHSREQAHQEAVARLLTEAKALREGHGRELAALQRRLAEAERERQQQAAQRLRVAAIMDVFTFASFDPECELIQLRPAEWASQLLKFNPDFVFVESAWQGFEDLWKTKVSHNAPELQELLAWCKKKRIRTVFWNKEDPVHFSTFLPVAAQVDFVFTTDADCIPSYKHALGHERVFLLPFAAQPKAHNPAEKYERKDRFGFAGSYYLRYPERQRDFARLIDTVGKSRPVDIYDRNYYNSHPHYKFPDEYKPLILGSLPFSEIDKAYKGYRFGINMNTIKQSQTMFARRVFELLASNTVVIGNFSRGARLFFGDLLVASDNAAQIEMLVSRLVEDELYYRKYRLLGLRKVMSEHTYQHRLNFIASKFSPDTPKLSIPRVLVLGSAATLEHHEAILAAFERQTHANRSLYLLSRHDRNAPGIEVFSDVNALIAQIHQRWKNFDYIGFFSAADHYGTSYLSDLALASYYADAPGFGKSAYYAMIESKPVLQNSDASYRITSRLMLRAAIIRSSIVDDALLRRWFAAPEEATIDAPRLLALDEFNYCRNGTEAGVADLALVDDLDMPHQGSRFDTIQATADAVSASAPRSSSSDKDFPEFDAAKLATMFRTPADTPVRLALSEDSLIARSALDASIRQYVWAEQKFRRDDINLVASSTVKLDLETDMDVRLVCEFYDSKERKLSHSMLRFAGVHAMIIPEDCHLVRFALRFQGSGQAKLRRIVFGVSGNVPAIVLGKSRYLVLTKQYPRYDDIYRYGFLHSRVRAYRRAGIEVDVFRMSSISSSPFDEFEGIDVASGDRDLLDATLRTGQYTHVLVHMIDNLMWSALKPYLEKIRITVWIHGAEIQMWQRRSFEFPSMSAAEINRQKRLSDQRKKLWWEIFSTESRNISFVFVSRYLLLEAQTDLGVTLNKERYSVIHNYIDPSIFEYTAKTEDYRNKVLSVRSYASRKYANDLSVAAILELSKRKMFEALTFHLVGDGELFDDLTTPLRRFPNVNLEKRFLTHRELDAYHKLHGIFLNPTRWDSQGVSRDEAMASGLVPVTTRVAAIPEFVDENSGVIVPPEDPVSLANGIEDLYNHPVKFLRLSKGAAERVRRQSGFEQTILRELELLR